MENNNPPVPPTNNNDENDLNKQFNEQFGNQNPNINSGHEQNKINQNVNPYQHFQQNNPGGNTNQFNQQQQGNFNQGQGGNFGQNVPPGQYGNPGYYQKGLPVPNGTTALVLGIISLVVWLCYGVPGIVCAIIAISLGKKGVDTYMANPSMYDLASYNNARAGKICGIIGLILGGLYFLMVIFAIIFGAMGASGLFR